MRLMMVIKNVINLALDVNLMEEVELLGVDFQFMIIEDKLIFSPFRKDKWMLKDREEGKDYVVNQYVLNVNKLGDYKI